MTLVISDDGAIVTNSVTIGDAPAVRIAGNGVTFTNGTGGILSGTAAGGPTIELIGIGSFLVNQAGARIETSEAHYSAISGTAGSERVDNYGDIYGVVRLAGGADIFNEYRSNTATGTTDVELGEGDDTYNLYTDTGFAGYNDIDGGAGVDTLNLQSNQSIIYGFGYSGFEHLIVGANLSNLSGFSGYQSITLAAGGFNNFVNSSNPTLDLALDFTSLSIGPGSAFRNITGGGATDFLTLSSALTGSGSLTGSANLGGGNDYFRISIFAAGLPQPEVTGLVDGGSGTDFVSITTRDNGVIDLSDVINFESLGIDTQTLDPLVTAHISNANGFQSIVGGNHTLISSSYSPDAQLWSGFLYRTTLAATTTVGHYGQTLGSTYNPNNLAQIMEGDAAFNLHLVNNGTIAGPVQFYIGNDIYDGSLGTTGGTIYGYAGDDSLTGGAGAERIEGGFGNDILAGNGGADQLYGDGGDDRIVADVFDLVLAGGAGSDTLIFSGSGAMAGSLNSFEVLELVSGANLALTDSQLSQGFAPTAALGGTGTLTVNMSAPGIYFAKFLNVANTVSMAVNGTSGNDIFRLANAANAVESGDGLDQIKGGNLADTINGGGGADKINGEGGADILTGGAGGDVFKYGGIGDSMTGSGADRITDYAIGIDRLNFARIDTNGALAGDQAFAFIGTGSFTGTGIAQIRYGSSGSNLLVLADVNGDGTADMEIILQGLVGGTLTAADFVL